MQEKGSGRKTNACMNETGQEKQEKQYWQREQGNRLLTLLYQRAIYVYEPLSSRLTWSETVSAATEGCQLSEPFSPSLATNVHTVPYATSSIYRVDETLMQ